MSGFLLDTNIISELVKPKPEPRVVAWVGKTDESLLFLSVLTLGEIRKGIDSLSNASRRITLESWLNHDVAVRFAHRILHIDLEVADRWGRIAAKAVLVKRPIHVLGGLLAATALQHNLTFATRNIRDVLSTGVPVFNPWES
jgi:predicted nucleic acid-binding protein